MGQFVIPYTISSYPFLYLLVGGGGGGGSVGIGGQLSRL